MRHTTRRSGRFTPSFGRPVNALDKPESIPCPGGRRRHDGPAPVSPRTRLQGWQALPFLTARRHCHPALAGPTRLAKVAGRAGVAGLTPSIDLAHTNPALALGLAALPQFKPVSRRWRTAGRLVRRRMREIAAYLGFPDRQATVRLLRKIQQTELTVPHLLALRVALTRPETMPRLAHLRRIDGAVVAIIGDETITPYASRQLIFEVSELRCGSEETLELLRDTVSLARRMSGGHPPPTLQSIAQVSRLRRQLALERRERTKGTGRGPFPAPPCRAPISWASASWRTYAPCPVSGRS